MRNQLLVASLAIAIAASRVSGQQSQPLLPESWVGGTNILGTWRFAQLRFSVANGSLKGSMDVPGLNAMRLPLSGTVSSAGDVQFTANTPLGALHFAGLLKDRVIDGSINSASGIKGDLHLVPSAALDSSVYKKYVGTYTLDDSSTLVVTFRPFGQLAAVQFATADGKTLLKRSINLVPLDDTTFFTSTSVVIAVKQDEVLRFGKRPKDPLRWQRRGAQEIRGVRSDGVRQQWVVIRNGNVTLNGTLYTPAIGGPFRTIVSVGGSGPTTRDQTLPRALELVRVGLSVLVLDKRGTGDPSGAWNTATINDLASDARAALRWLRRQKGIDPRQIGIHGHSQGGWVAMTVLARDTTAKFAIFTSSTPLKPGEQEAYRAEAQARAAGASDADAIASRELMRLKWNFALTGKGWDELKSAAMAAKGKPWEAIASPPSDSASALWADVRAFRGFDPLPLASQVKVPVLLLFGSADQEVPPAQSQELWREALRAAANTRGTIVELPGLSHGMFLRAEGNTVVIAPEVSESIRLWLSQALSSKSH